MELDLEQISSYQRDYIHILKGQLKERKERNSSFSMRAFAKFLDTPASALSLILNGKRPLTKTKASAFATKLKLQGSDFDNFMDAVNKDEYSRHNETERKEKKLNSEMNYETIELDQFAIVNDWYHFGILNLTSLDHYQSDPKWISKTLEIGLADCLTAIARLKRLGLLSEKNGILKRTNKSIETPTDIPSESIRNYHKQNIERAVSCLEDVDIKDRDITSIMMPVDKDKIIEAKKMIKNFRKELSAFLKSGEKSDQVYSLNIQLFPQSKEEIK